VLGKASDRKLGLGGAWETFGCGGAVRGLSGLLMIWEGALGGGVGGEETEWSKGGFEGLIVTYRANCQQDDLSALAWAYGVLCTRGKELSGSCLR
jgi:hypothetical protein